jgi:transcriptional regulator of acetoin/glycerol metabolism
VRSQSSSVSRFVAPLPFEHSARWAIVESWNRCAGLSAHAPPEFHRVSDDDLTGRIARAARLLEAARPRMHRLVHSVQDVAVAYVTDAEGIVLACAGNDAQLRRYCLLPGYDWSEARMGTNGAGTCLVTGRPMVVSGAEHYVAALRDRACTAVPIRGPDARIVGALDVTTRVADARRDRMGRVTEAALEIEAQLRQP